MTDLTEADHVSRYAPYKKLIHDDHGTPIALSPLAFEMREIDKGKLSVNWLEYFKKTHQENIESAVKDFRNTRMRALSNSCAFGIGNVGELKRVCADHNANKVRVFHNGKKGRKNESHATIIRLPENDDTIMQQLAAEVFKNFVLNSNI